MRIGGRTIGEGHRYNKKSITMRSEGRRRVWMVAAVPVMMLAVWKLFFPAPPVDANYLLVWMCVLWLGWTMLLIPYYAWAATAQQPMRSRG